MAFDGGFLKKITEELKSACGAHVDKIYQPSKDELVFLMRKKGFAERLLITVKPGSARMHFTESRYENPQTPPNFCMLIRKYLSAAKLVDITQPELERLAELIFTASNEMGDIVDLRLICEFIGNKTNIILVGADGRIIDSLRHSDPETADRMILPGAVYEYPSKAEKLNPLACSSAQLCEAIQADADTVKALLNNIDGFSPLVCREAAHKAEASSLEEALNSILNDLKNEGTPILLKKPDGSPFEFSYTDITQYGTEYEKQYYKSFSALLDAFFAARDNSDRIRHAAGDIIKLVNNLRTRTEKKLALRLEELKASENREELRIYGELIKANLYNIKNGASFAEVQNYYDSELKTIRIPLNPALTPQKNAAKYFKDYKKTYTAQQTLTALTEKDREELEYFDSVSDSISRSTTLAEISEIREELCEAGYIKQTTAKRRKNNIQPVFKEYISSEGYKILVGKNNRQNDLLTTSIASKNDLWFHVKNIPGSHVVVFNGGCEVSEQTVFEAARLAAENSKAASSSSVPVDYTPVKFVKKPNGAKPGMVIYTTNKTVFVTPETSKGKE